MNINCANRLAKRGWGGEILDTSSQDRKKICQGIFRQYSPNLEALPPIENLVISPSPLEQAKKEILQGKPFLEVIETFRIEDESKKIILAKLEAGVDADKTLYSKTSECIHLYGITSEEARIEIAKIAAATKGLGTSFDIQNYNIQSEFARFEIAMIAAAKSSQGLCKFIQNYEIANEKYRIEIAKFLAARSGLVISMYIQNFCIQDKAAHAEIFEIALNQDFMGATDYALNYEIDDDARLFELCGRALFFIINSYDAPVAKIKKFIIDWGSNPYFGNHCLIASYLLNPPEDIDNQKSLYTTQLSKMVIDKFPLHEAQIQKLFNKITNSKTFKWSALVSIYLLYEVSEPDLEMIIKTGVLEDIASYHGPKMRFLFLRLVSQTICDEMDISTYFDILQNIESSNDKNKKSHSKIFALYYTQLYKKGVDVETLKRMIQYTKHRLYKSDIVKQRKLIEVLNIILEDQLLEPEQLTLLLQYLFPEGEELNAKESYRQVLALIGLVGFISLDVFRQDPKDLVLLLTEYFNKIVPYGNDPEIAEKINAKITSSRCPSAPLVYAGMLKKLPLEEQSEMLNAYMLYIHNLLNDTYYPYRYCLNLQGSHLKIVFEGREILFEKWRKGGSCTLSELLMEKGLEEGNEQDTGKIVSSSQKEYRIVDTDDPEDMLLSGTEVEGSCQSVYMDPAYSKGLVAYLNDGKIRMIAVKNKDGRIVARSIFRVLLKDGSNEPILFLERIYCPKGVPEFARAIIAFAKNRAEDLGLPLVSVETKSEEKFDSSIISLGSPAPYEYVDACSGIQKGGSYTISSDSLYLLQP